MNSRWHRIGRSVVGNPHRLALAAIFIAALSLRLYALDWDQGTFLHPDELHVVNTATLGISLPFPIDWENLADPDYSTMNPRAIDPASGQHANYAYGALPIYVTDSSAWLLSQVTDRNWQSYTDGLYKVGRFLSAIFDTLTVAIVYLIGRKLGGRTAGLIGATLYAAAPAPIQLAHFFTTDAWLAFFVTLTLLLAIRAAERGTPAAFAFTGFAFGLAMATKASVSALALVIAAAIVWDAWERRRFGAGAREAALAIAERGLGAALWAVLAFTLFEPYALASPGVYLDQLSEQAQIVSGSLDVPFTRQYVGTVPLLYQIEQLFRWGLGPVTTLFSLVGVVAVLVALVRRPSPGLVVLGSWFFVQGLVVLVPETKFMRYLAPLLPAMAAAGGWAAWRLIGWIRALGHVRLASAGAVAGLIGVGLWTASFASIYAAPNPRVSASVWMYDNFPAGSRISSEIWDLAMPLALAQGLMPSDFLYARVEMDIYGDRDPSDVANDIYRYLERADYVVLASNRLTTAIPNLPWRYPVQAEYYRLLQSGELGFERVADFTREPGFGPLRWDDQWADESYLNYDHPRVQIFRKISLLPRDSYDLLMSSAVGRDTTPTRHPVSKTLLLDEPVGSLPVVDNGRWSERLTSHSLAALAVWLVLLAALQYTGSPIAAYLFRRAPDRGGGFARLIALLLAGYASWLPASLGAISFRSIWVGVTFALLALLSLGIRRRTDRSFRPRLFDLRGPELAFWLVFALFLLFRWINPDSWHPVWGGEKPMEFAHLNAILRSAHFPPYDPWFADGYLNYYYYGTYLIAFLCKLTGIPSEIAFNLAQPTLIAMIAAGAWSVAASLVTALGGRRFAMLGGAIGALFVSLAGNLVALAQLVRAFPDYGEFDFYTWTWLPSRAITGGITEFPYFTGLYADLHAHVIAWPMTLLVIALAFEHARQPRALLVALSNGRSSPPELFALLARLAMLALTIGSLAVTNAWDVAIYVAIVAVACWLSTSALNWWAMRSALTVGMVAGVGVVGFGAFLPFFNHYVALFGSLERTRSSTALSEFSLHLGGWILIIFVGLVALRAPSWRGDGPRLLSDPILLGSVLVAAGIAAFLPSFTNESIGGIGRFVLLFVAALAMLATFVPDIAHRLGWDRWLPALLAAAMMIASAGLLVAEEPVLALCVVLASAGGLLYLTGDRLGTRFVGMMIAAGASIAAGVEIVFLVDDLEPDPVWYRMNTIFKFYNQVWMLFALSAAVFAALAIARLWSAPEASTETDPIGRSWQWTTALVASVVLTAGLLYPLTSTKPRLEQRFEGHPTLSTLNALDWMRYGTVENGATHTIAFADDLAAIQWFNANVAGSPVIAEASIGPYRGNGSRFSIATGLPTILGWERHEEQQRYPDDLPIRADDVRELYDNPDPAVKEEILRRYTVEYVVVGDVERYTTFSAGAYASAAGIAALEGMVGTTLEVAFQHGSTTIFRVLPPPSS